MFGDHFIALYGALDPFRSLQHNSRQNSSENHFVYDSGIHEPLLCVLRFPG